MPINASIPLSGIKMTVPNEQGMAVNAQNILASRAHMQHQQNADAANALATQNSEMTAQHKASIEAATRIVTHANAAYTQAIKAKKTPEEANKEADKVARAMYAEEAKYQLKRFPDTKIPTYEQAKPLLDQWHQVLTKFDQQKQMESMKNTNALSLQGKRDSAAMARTKVTAQGKSGYGSQFQATGPDGKPAFYHMNKRTQKAEPISGISPMPKTGPTLSINGDKVTYSPYGMTSTQRGKQNVDLQNTEIAFRQSLASINDIVQKVKKNGSSVGLSGSLAKGMDTIKEQSLNLAKMAGVDIRGSFNKQLSGYDWSSFKNVGVLNAQLKGALLSLARSSAAMNGESSSKLSDKDVQQYLDMIGGSAGNKDQLIGVISDFSKRLKRNFKIKYETITGKQYNDGESNTVTVNGRTYVFKSKTDADNFKSEAGIQ